MGNSKVLKEKVISNKVKKVYNYNDVNKWIRYGLRKGLVNMDDKESVIKWISLLKGLNFEL